MNTLSVRISYRPIRIGWCVAPGDFAGLDRALRLSHCLWGGRFNPLIPIDHAERAKRLVDVFRVDALFPVSTAPDVRAFVAAQKHLPWPLLQDGVFPARGDQPAPSFLDVRAGLDVLQGLASKHTPGLPFRAVRPTWSPDDALNLVLLATFGAYADPHEVGVDYTRAFDMLPMSECPRLGATAPVPTDALIQWLTPSELTALDLYNLATFNAHSAGLYIGDASDFADLVCYWNLRAANLDILFYDPAHNNRLAALARTHCESITANPGHQFAGRPIETIAVWSSEARKVGVPQFVGRALRCAVGEATWNGLNVRPDLMRFEPQWCLGILEELGDRPGLFIQLPAPPFPRRRDQSRQHVVISLDAGLQMPKNDSWTFSVPYVPEINEYLGREVHYIPISARAEPHGLGVSEDLAADSLRIRALDATSLVATVFRLAGISASASAAGLVARRVIDQMGGLQGCRPFKIRGVRELLAMRGARTGITWDVAMRTIGQTLEPHQGLIIERRTGGGLTPQAVFDYLCRKGVFRVGLELKCDHCGQHFWLHVDDVREKSQCEYCGTLFRVTPQLRDGGWRYRRSGLFGRENNQEGAVPVALLLQQLHTALNSSWLAFTTGLDLEGPVSANDRCETDFAVLARGDDGSAQLAIGECKAAGSVEQSDIDNLRRVADAFARTRVSVFLLFAKTSPFTESEVSLCRSAQARYEERVILLSARELEPYFLYENALGIPNVNRYAGSLPEMTRNTQATYFDPRP